MLSDSHGRASTTRRGVAILLDQKVDLLLHLGDIGTVEVIDALAVPAPDGEGLLEAHMVFGNTDWDQGALTRYAEELGISVDDPAGSLDLEEGELVFCHGHEAEVLTDALSRQVRYLCHGHTHTRLDTQRGETRIINPGALFRAQTYSVAVLDTAANELQFYDVGGGG